MDEPDMIAVYFCNEAWVKRAILRYHKGILNFDYPEKEFDTEVKFPSVDSVRSPISDDFATITVTKKVNRNSKRSDRFFNWRDVWYYLTLQHRKVGRR